VGHSPLLDLRLPTVADNADDSWQNDLADEGRSAAPYASWSSWLLG
jgi:hypothetical protein